MFVGFVPQLDCLVYRFVADCRVRELSIGFRELFVLVGSGEIVQRAYVVMLILVGQRFINTVGHILPLLHNLMLMRIADGEFTALVWIMCLDGADSGRHGFNNLFVQNPATASRKELLVHLLEAGRAPGMRQ